MLSPEAVSAIAIAASGAFSALLTELLHRRSAKRRATLVEHEREKRRHNITVAVNETICEVMRAMVDSAIARNMHRPMAEMDKRLAAFEVALKSALSLTANAHEEHRRVLSMLLDRERDGVEEKITIRRTLQALNDATQQLLALFEPVKTK